MKILPIIESALEAPLLPEYRNPARLYPSSASIKVYDPMADEEVIKGACLRREFYRMTGVPEDPPSPDPKQRQAMLRNARQRMYGEPIAQIEMEMIRRAGIPVIGEEVKFELSAWRLSGRIDAVLLDPNDSWAKIGVEIKSVGASSFRYIQNKPKPEHVLQVMVYAGVYANEITQWVIPYFCREPGKWDPVEHQVRLMPDGHVSVNGQKWEGYTVNKVFERYRELLEAVDARRLPDRDFELEYSQEKIRDMARKGLLNKTDTAAVRRGKKVVKGDFQCNYCPFKNRCWGAEK